MRVAFVKAGWHADIVDSALAGFAEEMARLGYDPEAIDVFDVPGAFEIPLHAKMIARSAYYSAVIGAAFVVNGGIYRHDFVSETVVGALMQVQLQTDVPMISVILTPHNFHEHEEHRNFFREHFVTKGAEAARACASTVESLRRLPRRAAAA
ncbi:MAG: 6,7-dimethyl-8-ribityllumazine synthase [Hyphomonadaceae bacterium]